MVKLVVSPTNKSQLVTYKQILTNLHSFTFRVRCALLLTSEKLVCWFFDGNSWNAKQKALQGREPISMSSNKFLNFFA